MIIVAVMIFVIEPIWQMVSFVLSSPVRVFVTPVLATKRCVIPVSRSMRSAPAMIPGTRCRLAVSDRNRCQRAGAKSPVGRIGRHGSSSSPGLVARFAANSSR